MYLITVASRNQPTRHLVDADKYSRLSKGKALCGVPGKRLVQFDAAFWNYDLTHPHMCEKCQAIVDTAANEKPC